MKRRLLVGGVSGVFLAALVAGYTLGRARADGIPPSGALSYAGRLEEGGRAVCRPNIRQTHVRPLESQSPLHHCTVRGRQIKISIFQRVAKGGARRLVNFRRRRC